MSRSGDKGSLYAVAASVQGVHNALLEGSVGYFLVTFFEARFRPAAGESAKSPLPLADLKSLLRKSYLHAIGGEGDMASFNDTMEYLGPIYEQAPDAHDKISFYDQNTLFFLENMQFPLRQVFSVIVEILWDREGAYFPGSTEDNKLARLYFFYKELEDLALLDKNRHITICHTGIRQTVMLSLQGLEPILNGKKHIIYFPQGGVNYFIDKLIADGLSHYLFTVKNSDFDSWFNIMKAWVMPSSERNSDSNGLLERFFTGLVIFCNNSIFTENIQKALFNVGHDARAAATQDLIKNKISLTSLQQLSCPIESTIVANLQALLSLKEDENVDRNIKLATLKRDISTKALSSDVLLALSDFILVEEVYCNLKYCPTLVRWKAECIHPANLQRIISSYYNASLAYDSKRLLEAFKVDLNNYHHDREVDFLSNFFAIYWDLPTLNKQGEHIACLNQEGFVEKWLASDDWLDSFQAQGDGGTIFIEPAELNRVLIHALVIHVADWSDSFKRAFALVLNYIDNELGTAEDEGMNHIVKKDSYRNELVEFLKILKKVSDQGDAVGLTDGEKSKVYQVMPLSMHQCVDLYGAESLRRELLTSPLSNLRQFLCFYPERSRLKVLQSLFSEGIEEGMKGGLLRDTLFAVLGSFTRENYLVCLRILYPHSESRAIKDGRTFFYIKLCFLPKRDDLGILRVLYPNGIQNGTMADFRGILKHVEEHDHLEALRVLYPNGIEREVIKNSDDLVTVLQCFKEESRLESIGILYPRGMDDVIEFRCIPSVLRRLSVVDAFAWLEKLYPDSIQDKVKTYQGFISVLSCFPEENRLKNLDALYARDVLLDLIESQVDLSKLLDYFSPSDRLACLDKLYSMGIDREVMNTKILYQSSFYPYSPLCVFLEKFLLEDRLASLDKLYPDGAEVEIKSLGDFYKVLSCFSQKERFGLLDRLCSKSHMEKFIKNWRRLALLLECFDKKERLKCLDTLYPRGIDAMITENLAYFYEFLDVFPPDCREAILKCAYPDGIINPAIIRDWTDLHSVLKCFSKQNSLKLLKTLYPEGSVGKMKNDCGWDELLLFFAQEERLSALQILYPTFFGSRPGIVLAIEGLVKCVNDRENYRNDRYTLFTRLDQHRLEGRGDFALSILRGGFIGHPVDFHEALKISKNHEDLHRIAAELEVQVVSNSYDISFGVTPRP